jgi:hypothetical protein
VVLVLGATVASGALTWRMCVRPMLRGQGCRRASAPLEIASVDIARAQEIAALREEVRSLRAVQLEHAAQ